MWCKVCRQDVPALPSGEKQTLCCPRCGETLRAPCRAEGDSPIFAETKIGTVPGAAAGGENESVPLGTSFGSADRPPFYDSWQLDEELQHIHRVLHAGKAGDSRDFGACTDLCVNDAIGASGKGDSPIFADAKIGTVPSPVGPRQAARFDPPQGGPPARHVPGSNRPGRRRKKSGRRGAVSSLLTWFVFTLGLVSSACGGVLLGWSLASGRQELWNMGMPVALVGQVALLAGLVLQIDRLWHDNRAAASKLDDVDEQIHQLKTTTMLLGTGQGSASATFYAHLASGASPQLLLTDLKSQLDLLAMRIAQET
jgi:hypothetical protein